MGVFGVPYWGQGEGVLIRDFRFSIADAWEFKSKIENRKSKIAAGLEYGD
jgi:hypothetical protein